MRPQSFSARLQILTVSESIFRSAKFRDELLIAYRAASDLAGKASMFVIVVVAARRLSPAEFGVLSLSATTGWIMAIAADFGIQFYVARAVARAPERSAPILAYWLRVRMWTTGLTILVVAIELAVVRATPSFAVPMLIFAVMYGASGLIEFLHYFYRGVSRSDVESTLVLWQRVATLAAGLVALWRWPDIRVLGVALLVPIIATLGASLRIARRLGDALTAGHTAATSDRPAVRALLGDVLPIGAGILLSALYFRIDLFLVEAWKGSEAVARYNAVFRVVEALRLFPAAVLAVSMPALCRARDLGVLVRVATKVTAFAVLATLMLSAVAGWMIPLVYGERYASAVQTFRILMLAFPLLSLNYALTHQLLAWDRQWAYAVICGLALIVNVALNTRLIPAFSIEGAAWATVATEVFLSAGCMVGLRSKVSSARRIETATVSI
jgi:O-antigen/teichoic acid export membrane protein